MTDIQPPLSWSFGDPTGWAIACGFFCLFRQRLGGACAASPIISSAWGLLTKGNGQAADPVLFWAGSALIIFAAFYFASLRGFPQLDYRTGQLTIHYMLPERTVVLPFIEVMNVQEVPAFKGQWRLVVVTDTSGIYESALSSQADVNRAAELLRRQMVRPYSSRR